MTRTMKPRVITMHSNDFVGVSDLALLQWLTLKDLGTNLLTVTNGQSFFGQTSELPKVAPGMISRIGPVTQVQETGSVTATAYRSPLIPSVNTNGPPLSPRSTWARSSMISRSTVSSP